jgi:TIR domain
MSYQYDAFFSYKRDPESDTWHQRVKDKLHHWIRMDLNQADVAIFFDTEDIRSGQRWRTKLETALKTSKCAICVWSPLYFRSKWCVSEWTTFEQRGRHLRLDLVIPARYHDGEHYPGPAKDIQSVDFSDYASTMPRFWDTERAVEFERSLLRPFARDLAEIIRAAPPFDPRFQVFEAGDDLIIQDTRITRVGDG